jgi:hypothetical protein
MSVELLGDKELSRKLDALGGRASRRAITTGVSAALTPLARAMRSAVNASSASADLKRAARATIGKRFSTTRVSRNEKQAKAGFAVGKPSKVKAAKARKRSAAGGGVGVSAANIHWFVLGTADRTTKSGHSTGRISPAFTGVMQQAFSASQSTMVAVARAKISQVIEREARRT